LAIAFFARLQTPVVAYDPGEDLADDFVLPEEAAQAVHRADGANQTFTS